MENDRFKSNVAVLVAFVTVMGAMAACLASVAVSNASDADFAGLDAAIRAQKAEIINEVYAYQHYHAYTTYMRYTELGTLLFDPEADEETAFTNGAVQREVWGIASGLSYSFFSPRYIKPDGKYDVNQELQEARAEDAQNEDLDSDPYFAESDRLRSKSSFLTADMIVIAFSFWFLTVAQTTDKKIKYLWLILGIITAIAGIAGIIYGSFLI